MTPENALKIIEALTANLSEGARELVWDFCGCFKAINGELRFWPVKGRPVWIMDAENKKAFLESLKNGLCDGELLDGRDQEDVEEAFSAVQKMLNA